MRKLASIEVIDKLEPIPNADRILKATIKGWECVVSKSDNFKEGDKVIYIEVDSVLPPRPEFAFMAERKYRVKTIKLRKQISQGLVLPMIFLKKDYPIGTDVTKELGITKFDPQADEEQKLFHKNPPKGLKGGLLKFLFRFEWFRKLYAKFVVENCKFPTEVAKKTDEERIQNMPTAFEDFSSHEVPFFATEKVDGCSATFFVCNNQFGVCSRNLWLRKEDNSHYWEVARRFQLEEILRDMASSMKANKVVIQGEIIGNNIQGNKYKISGYDFYVFNIIVDDIKLDQEKMTYWCGEYALNTVPVVYVNYTLPKTIQELVEVSKGKSRVLESQQREGLVLRNYKKNISFKVINPEFLLKNE